MTHEKCGAKTRDGDPCENPPMEGRNRCYHHGGATEDAGAPEGEANGSYEHGAFSKYIRSNLNEEEKQAFDELRENMDEVTAREAAAEALLRYRRSGEDCFLREWRQICSEFNIIENVDEVAGQLRIEREVIDESSD